MSETSVDFHSKYTGEQLEARLDRCNLTPTVTGVPGEDYLSFVDDEGTHAFRIGDECRYHDTGSGEYTFYKLRDITAEGKAVWGVVGEGGGDAGEVVTFNVTSNQGALGEEFQNLMIKVEYDDLTVSCLFQGIPVEMPLPSGKVCRVIPPEIPGYRTPEGQVFETVAGGERVISLPYSAERVTLTVTSTNGTDCSGQVITVKDGDDTLLESEVGTGLTFLVPTGTEYVITCSLLNGHKSPSPITLTASQQVRVVPIEYMYIRSLFIVFDRSVIHPANITVGGDIDIENWREQFIRVLGKLGEDGKMYCCRLMDDNSTQYHDGKGAALDGSEGDCFVAMNPMWYRHEGLDDTHFRYLITPDDVDDTFNPFGDCLIGTYKGYVVDGKLYSRSGVAPTTGMTFDEFVMAAKARGTGYQLVDFSQHCYLAMLLYGLYKTRDLQSVLGSGKAFFDTDNVTGTSDATGMADTTPGSEGYVCGLGVEGIFGGIYEYMQGLRLQDGAWIITDPDGTERSVKASDNPVGWIRRMVLEEGDHFDMIPTATGGSGSTNYADYTEMAHSLIPLVAARSGFTASDSDWQDCGVGYLNALNASYIPSAFYGTRLAWRGELVFLDDVEEFKALPIIG